MEMSIIIRSPSASVAKLSSEIPLLSFLDKLPQPNYFYAKNYLYMELNFPTTPSLTIMVILTNLKVVQLLTVTFSDILYLFHGCMGLCQAIFLPER